MTRFALAGLLLFAVVASSARADEATKWDQFRGPKGTGVHPTAEPPVEFGPDQHVLWKTPVHGRGWSSPVTLDGRVWLTTATEDGKRLSALSLDLETGKVISDRVVFEVDEPRFCHPTNSYASCTPCVEAGRVYVHFGSYGTACLDAATGDTLWERRDFVSDDFRGPASSPILHGDLLIVQHDGIDFQFVVALNKTTGETVWRRDRDIEYGTDNGDYKKAYGTPTVIRVGETEQLISVAAVNAVAYDPTNGNPIWRIKQGGMNSAAPPLFDGERLYLTGGSGPTSLVAVSPTGSGDITDSHLQWNSGKSVPQRSSPLLVDGLLITTDDNGVAMCRDATTGKLHWRKRLGGTFWSSPVTAAGRVYAFNKSGEGFIFAAEPEYRELAKIDLGEEINATPAIVGDTLIVRTLGQVYRFSD